jgi:hypothetical protein
MMGSFEKQGFQKVLALGILLWASAFMLTKPSAAYELSAIVGLETELTDNVNLTEDKESDIGMEAFTEFSFQDRSPTLEALVDGRLGYRTSLQGVAPDEIRPSIHGNLRLHLQPERFSWSLDGAWEQVRTDTLGPDSPENLENQLVISTGPDIRLPMTARTSFTAAARLGYSSGASDSVANADSSSMSYEADFGLVRTLGNAETVSANLTGRAVRYNEAEFDDASSDFNLVDTWLAYANRTRRGETSIGVGASYADPQDRDGSVGWFLRANADWRLTSITRGGLRMNFGYDDQSNAVLTRPLLRKSGDITESESTGVYYQSRAEGFLEAIGRRARLLGILYINRDDYVEDSTRDELDYGATIAWSRQLSRFTDLRIYGTAEYTELTNEQSDSQRYTAAIEMTRRLSRNLSANLRVRHQRGTGNTATSEYDESALILGLVYQFSGTTPLFSTAYYQQQSRP